MIKFQRRKFKELDKVVNQRHSIDGEIWLIINNRIINNNKIISKNKCKMIIKIKKLQNLKIIKERRNSNK